MSIIPANPRVRLEIEEDSPSSPCCTEPTFAHNEKRVTVKFSEDRAVLGYEEVRNPTWFQWVCCCFCALNPPPPSVVIDTFQLWLKERYNEKTQKFAMRISKIDLEALKRGGEALTVGMVRNFITACEEWLEADVQIKSLLRRIKYFQFASGSEVPSPLSPLRDLDILVSEQVFIFVRMKDKRLIHFDGTKLEKSLKSLLPSIDDIELMGIVERVGKALLKQHTAVSQQITVDSAEIALLAINEMKALGIVIPKPTIGTKTLADLDKLLYPDENALFNLYLQMKQEAGTPGIPAQTDRKE